MEEPDSMIGYGYYNGSEVEWVDFMGTEEQVDSAVVYEEVWDDTAGTFTYAELTGAYVSAL